MPVIAQVAYPSEGAALAGETPATSTRAAAATSEVGKRAKATGRLIRLTVTGEQRFD
ncbi:hypothetical protein GCM10027413_10270 [Conyzicola nivalis]